LPVKEVYNLRGKKVKANQERKVDDTFIKHAQGQPMVETSITTLSNKKKADDSPSKKRRKRNIPSMMMTFKRYLMSLWLQKSSLF